MRTIMYAGSLLISALFLGCDTGHSTNSVISAQISWSEDVSDINMTEVGLAKSEISQNSIHELQPGQGTVYWTSSGTEYSRTIDIGGIEEGVDDNVECEQEGEHEGENEGCLFSFTFSGDQLSISK